jgi:hypothetical protein
MFINKTNSGGKSSSGLTLSANFPTATLSATDTAAIQTQKHKTSFFFSFPFFPFFGIITRFHVSEWLFVREDFIDNHTKTVDVALFGVDCVANGLGSLVCFVFVSTNDEKRFHTFNKAVYHPFQRANFRIR